MERLIKCLKNTLWELMLYYLENIRWEGNFTRNAIWFCELFNHGANLISIISVRFLNLYKFKRGFWGHIIILAIKAKFNLRKGLHRYYKWFHNYWWDSWKITRIFHRSSICLYVINRQLTLKMKFIITVVKKRDFLLQKVHGKLCNKGSDL